MLGSSLDGCPPAAAGILSPLQSCPLRRGMSPHAGSRQGRGLAAPPPQPPGKNATSRTRTAGISRFRPCRLQSHAVDATSANDDLTLRNVEHEAQLKEEYRLKRGNRCRHGVQGLRQTRHPAVDPTRFRPPSERRPTSSWHHNRASVQTLHTHRGCLRTRSGRRPRFESGRHLCPSRLHCYSRSSIYAPSFHDVTTALLRAHGPPP